MDDFALRALARDNIRTIAERGQIAEEQILTALLLGVALHVGHPQTANRIFEVMLGSRRSFIMSLLDGWLLESSGNR